ncbi:PorT family protein, partial [Parabacteroides distasonis]
MKKLILFVLCALSGLVVSAQSRWGITPEGGFAAVNRVGMGSSWRAGVKVGVGVSYQFEPGWIGLKSGLYYGEFYQFNLSSCIRQQNSL